MNRYVCLHGHFYQPPRENPWLERVEKQDSADPYHDWNERISSECYGPNAASRMVDDKSKIIDIVNNYSFMSFNFGPTLLSWMQEYEPDTYEAILDADKLSMERFGGHGSAIAQGYNHIILPLANARDKYTQVLWGIRDFESRFNRKPEGMWLAETAIDAESLEVMAELGIKYSILAPRQASKIRKIGTEQWVDVAGTKIDPRRSYVCNLPSGRSIMLFFYDGPVAQDIAFGGLLADGHRFADRLFGIFSDDAHDNQLVHVATDGESYGHHHRFGDMALAYALYKIDNDDYAKLTIYGEYLDLVEPEYEVEIFENSSWSCVHGVERWRSDCGCNSGGRPEWNQKWRGPLRSALDMLRDTVAKEFEKQLSAYVKDPWELRNSYIEIILNRDENSVNNFFSKKIKAKLSKDDRQKILKFLEMQRHAMLMYTSCGWFFDEISGIETVQIMQYASRVIQLAKEICDLDLESKFLSMLRKAPSNMEEFANGADVYKAYVAPTVLDPLRVAVHYSISSLFEDKPDVSSLCCYVAKGYVLDSYEKNGYRMVVGNVNLFSTITQDEHLVDYVVIDCGNYRIQSAVSESVGEKNFKRIRSELKKSFEKGNPEKTVAFMSECFSDRIYSLRHLFADERRYILGLICQDSLAEVEKLYLTAYREQYGVMEVLRDSDVPLPPIFAQTVAFVLNTEVLKLLTESIIDFDKLKSVTEDLKKWSSVLDKVTLTFVFEKIINHLMDSINEEPADRERLEFLCAFFRMLRSLKLDLDLWKAQNIYFALSRSVYADALEKADHGDRESGLWLSAFDSLEPFLKVKK